MAQRIEAAKMVGPAIAARPAVNPGEDTAALEPGQAVQFNSGENGAQRDFGQAQRPNIEPVDRGEEDDPAVSDARRSLGIIGRDLKFAIDRESNTLVVQVRDPDSGRVERQIPQDEILQMREQLQKIAGLLFHQAA